MANTKKLTIAAALVVVLAIGVSVVTSAAPSGSAVTGFVWDFERSPGVAISYKLDASSLKPGQVLVYPQLHGELAEYWEVREVAAFTRIGDRRRRLVDQGPFPYPSEDKKTPRWMLRDLEDREYEIEFYLHRRKEGMSFAEVKKRIARDEALTIRLGQ
jgi:hypothetical protein